MLTTRPKSATIFYYEIVGAKCTSDMEVTSANITMFIPKFVEFRCGSNKSYPVDWKFSGEEEDIFKSGVLSYKYIGRYSVTSVTTSGAVEYSLRIEKNTRKEIGVYTCVDDAGFGPDKAAAELVARG